MFLAPMVRPSPTMLTRTATRPTTYLTNLLQTCIDNKVHAAGKILHAYILRAGIFADTFLANRLVELYAKCDQVDSARKLFDKMPQRNIYSWHAMLSCYCKENQLDNAHELFDQMPERNSVSWNMMISALVRNGYERRALEFYWRMRWGGFELTHFTLASVLSACGSLGDIMYGKECHGVANKLGLDKNVFVGNALLGMYAKSGTIGDAVKAFGDLLEPNEVSFTQLMGGLVEADQIEEAFGMFKLMHRNGSRIDSVSLSTVLGVCARGGNGDIGATSGDDWDVHIVPGKQIHGLTLKLGFENDLHLSNSLLDMYAKNGDMDNAEILFASLSEVSVVSWNIMIGGYGQNNEKGRAMQYMEWMQSSGFEPDDVTYINLLVACVKCGDVGSAHRIFDIMTYQSLSSWNAILSGCAQNGYHREAVKLFREMQLQEVQLDRTTLAIILSSCAALGYLEGGRQVHAFSMKPAFHTDTYVASGLIGMYFKCRRMVDAKHVFTGVHQLDTVCWNSMLAGLSFNSMDGEAFTLFVQMLRMGILRTEFSYATILSCCAKLSSWSQGRQVHGLIMKDGYADDVFVGSALLDIYSKCGNVNDARKFFDLMPSKNTVSWNAMLDGYAQNGCGDEAVCLYKQMIQSDAKPDDITFVAVLTACSHSGLVDPGMSIFNSMHEEHGVEPLADHYTCIIDSLGRAGRFNELEKIIDKMPYKDDPIVWEVLLSSCRVHSNVGLARRAADELFRLDQNNSAPYVLLANMYASLGRWDDANDVRSMMTEQQVLKDPGYSWIEHENGDACLLG
ncbi:hypothetical protein ACH5RR_025570 [Cinchona calisaya]|uniref:Pentatricopeptide repeat-containing protein n=1 Tax=Cinchona calisaya TaxID=153742 RepID=A0ABD2Z509_9GENT